MHICRLWRVLPLKAPSFQINISPSISIPSPYVPSINVATYAHHRLSPRCVASLLHCNLGLGCLTCNFLLCEYVCSHGQQAGQYRCACHHDVDRRWCLSPRVFRIGFLTSGRKRWGHCHRTRRQFSPTMNDYYL